MRPIRYGSGKFVFFVMLQGNRQQELLEIALRRDRIVRLEIHRPTIA